MVGLQFEVPPENFNVPSEELEEQFAGLKSFLPSEGLTHLGSMPQIETLVQAATNSSPLGALVPIRVEARGLDLAVALNLVLRLDPWPEGGFVLRTPDGDEARGMRMKLIMLPDDRANLTFNVRYEGLPVGEALSYARFLRALYREEGTLNLVGPAPDEDRMVLLDLPVSVDPTEQSEVEERLRLLEALDEIGEVTATEFFYPSQADEEDLKNLNHVLKVIRGGWVAQHVTDFTTPLNSEGVRNMMAVAGEQGEVLQDMALTAAWERVEVFGTVVDLGPHVRYVASARLVTPSSEVEEWLATGPGQNDSFHLRWVPADDAWVHVFYSEWPKPSLGAVRDDIRAFEEEHERSSGRFLRDWENGEKWAREAAGADVWRTLLQAERHLAERRQRGT